MTDETNIPQLDRVAAVLDGLSDATLLELYRTLLPFDNDMIAAAVARRALTGGSGSQPAFEAHDRSPDETDTGYAEGSGWLDDDSATSWVQISADPESPNWQQLGDVVNSQAGGLTIGGLFRAKEIELGEPVDGTYANIQAIGDRFYVRGSTGRVTKIASFTKGFVQASATLTYASMGENVFVATHGGVAGNDITIELADPGMPSQDLSVAVDGLAVTVNLATDGGGVITSTAQEIDDAMVILPEVTDLMTPFTNTDGLAEAVGTTNLEDGLNEEPVFELGGAGGIGFFDKAATPAAQPIVANVAVQDLFDALVALGLIADGT